MSGQETIASRFIKLNQLILGKSSSNLPNKFLTHRDGLLDVLFALYEECNVDYMRKDKHIAAFVDKFKGLMIELKSLRVNLRDFEVKKIIGRGHFGEVQVVREKATGDVYAMKVLRKEETLLQQNVAFYKEERDIMSISTSPWLTKLQYAFQDSNNLYLIMEFHPGGDMLSLLEKYDNVLPEDMCQFYLAELVLAIHSLHSMGYVHRDIKPDNILIDRTGHIKLADFGSASKLNPHKQVTSSMPVGTPDYVAPEVLAAMNPGPASSKSYGIECDWWSLGIVTYEMIFGSTPFADDKVLLTYNNIMNFKNSLQFPPEASEVSETLISVVKGLLEDASNRLGYDELVVHTFFTDIDWNNIHQIAPPFVPTVTSVDDTSNFDNFEPESRPYIGDLKSRKEFTGKNLPFVGFTYTTPFEAKVERLSSADDVYMFSPSSSFCDPDTDSRKKEIASLQNKISGLSTVEESLRTEINKLKINFDTKNKDLEKTKDEKIVLEQIIEELNAEVQQVRQLLVYEREHRVITEQKASQLVRCMKTKQKQDALRLRAKSLEFNKGEKEKNTLEEQLDEALSKIDEFVRERAELLEDLEATKHMLLQCQAKYDEEGRNSVSFRKKDKVMTVEMSHSSTSTPVENKEKDTPSSFSGEKDKMKTSGKSQSCSSQSSQGEKDSDIQMQDLRRLIYKLEKKNVELERDLEASIAAKKEKEALNTELQKTVSESESKIKMLQKEISDMIRQNSKNESRNSMNFFLRKDARKNDIVDSSESSVQEVTSDFSEMSTQETSDSSEISSVQEELSHKRVEQENIIEVEIDNDSIKTEEKKNLPCLSLAPINNIDIPCQNVKSFEESRISERVVLPDESDNQKQPVCLEDTSDLKQENEYLKTRIEVLSAEITKLKDNVKHIENSYSDFESLLKEKESALSEAKLDLRISTRKQQQAEGITSSLRERNKDLREKIKSLEEVANEKAKIESELREQLQNLESELSEKNQEVNEKQKLLEIEKAKHEEKVKALQYTCEISKDVTQKFARSQDHYEEIVKQNMDLIKEQEEKSRANFHLVEEIKALKSELYKKKNECTKFEKMNSTLKSTCMEMEEDLKDLEIIVDAREKTIQELQEHGNNLKLELKNFEDALRLSKADMKKAERKSEELVKHIEELTSEMDSNNFLLETEMKNLQDQLDYYKKIATDMEEQNAAYHKEISLQNSDCKSYSEKILLLESQLCEIKEEAAKHITQISSLKSSNLKLTQSLEDALELNKEAKQNIAEISNELESAKANYLLERVKLQETISQQIKLIDFLQAKTENTEKRKRPNIARLFARKENTSNTMPLQYKDVEKLLETERSRCRRLQDHLCQARAENVALQREMNNLKNSTINVEVPVSPVSRAMHCVIQQSPSADNDAESPVLVSRELINKFSKPPGMKHKIPHRFTNIMCMRSTKCCACLDSLHFGRPVAKCQECHAICHQTCAASLPSTCGLPSAFMQHFKTAVNNCTSSNAVENCDNRLSEGWIKVPKNNKLGWDRRYMRLNGNMLCLFDNSEERDLGKSLIKLDFSPKVARIVVTSAVSATELNYAASSDLPYVLKLEYFPLTTCWPQRCLYIMALNFTDKQMWVSTLEALADENQTEVDNCSKNKLVGKAVWTMKGDKLIDPLCTYILDENIVLLGAVDGLYVLKIVNKFTCSLKCKIDGLQYIYQIACLKSIGLVILIQGNERRLAMTHLSSVQTAVQKLGSSSLLPKPLCDISDCHLFSVEDVYHPDTPYLCIATSKSVMLYQWDSILKTFCNRKAFEMKEPCSCIHFTPKSLIFGSDSFYELDLNVFTVKKFFDDRDASLAGIIYGASHFRSFPIAIFQVSSSDEQVEYLMCFHEMGVFVNGNGQRTRTEDMKWSRLPLSFAYQLPYLFVTHFNSLEVIEIPPQNAVENGLQAVTLIQNPQYLGSAHVKQSIYLSSCHDQIIELILVDGNSIGRSDFQIQKAAPSSVGSYSPSSSGKESTAESDGLDFSFSTSIDQSLAEISADQISVSSKASSGSTSSQS